ncbi:putative phosphatidylethanolaminen-methyltransfer ase-lik e protein, partial [Trypanosoma theileri]
MSGMTSSIEWRSIVVAAVAIAGLPTLWNLIARNEYRHHTLERLTGGKKRGAYLLAAWIFFGSFLRDTAFMRAIAANPSPRILPFLSIVKSHQSNDGSS